MSKILTLSAGLASGRLQPNEVNQQIGIAGFTGFFGTFPTSQAVVDTASPFFIAGLDQCTGTVIDCINDNSTTGFAPTGAQANGQYLTPVAWHGSVSTALDDAAVSSTLGSPTFGTAPEPGTLALLGLGVAAIGLGRSRRR